MAKQGSRRTGKNRGRFALPKDSFGDTIVHLNRLTSREVGDWMDAGNDTIFVPHGPISGHGAWTTLGIHCHCAEAVAVLLARKCNGVVYPPIYTAFCGATRTYPGSVPFSYEFHMKHLKAVCHSLYSQGWRRIFLICHTNPEDLAAAVAARDLFDIEGELPVASLVSTRFWQSKRLMDLKAQYDGQIGEAICDYAALRVLHRDRPIAEPDLARDLRLEGGFDQNVAIRDAIRTLRTSGTRGIRYDAEREHSNHGNVGRMHQGKSDIEFGVRLLEALAEELLPSVEALRHHRDYILKHPAQRLKKQKKFENK